MVSVVSRCSAVLAAVVGAQPSQTPLKRIGSICSKCIRSRLSDLVISLRVRLSGGFLCLLYRSGLVRGGKLCVLGESCLFQAQRACFVSFGNVKTVKWLAACL